MLVLFLLLLTASVFLAMLAIERERQRIRFILSPRAAAVCDIAGCKHEPRIELDDGVWVCLCHL